MPHPSIYGLFSVRCSILHHTQRSIHPNPSIHPHSTPVLHPSIDGFFSQLCQWWFVLQLLPIAIAYCWQHSICCPWLPAGGNSKKMWEIICYSNFTILARRGCFCIFEGKYIRPIGGEPETYCAIIPLRGTLSLRFPKIPPHIGITRQIKMLFFVKLSFQDQEFV